MSEKPGLRAVEMKSRPAKGLMPEPISSGKRPHSIFDTLLVMPEVKELWYNGKEVKLDGLKFIGCRFDNCKLHVVSANFELHNCFIDDGTVIHYRGEIVKLIKLFNSRYPWVYESLPNFAPSRNDDGTITISS